MVWLQSGLDFQGSAVREDSRVTLVALIALRPLGSTAHVQDLSGHKLVVGVASDFVSISGRRSPTLATRQQSCRGLSAVDAINSVRLSREETSVPQAALQPFDTVPSVALLQTNQFVSRGVRASRANAPRGGFVIRAGRPAVTSTSDRDMDVGRVWVRSVVGYPLPPVRAGGNLSIVDNIL